MKKLISSLIITFLLSFSIFAESELQLLLSPTITPIQVMGMGASVVNTNYPKKSSNIGFGEIIKATASLLPINPEVHATIGPAFKLGQGFFTVELLLGPQFSYYHYEREGTIFSNSSIRGYFEKDSTDVLALSLNNNVFFKISPFKNISFIAGLSFAVGASKFLRGMTITDKSGYSEYTPIYVWDDETPLYFDFTYSYGVCFSF